MALRLVKKEIIDRLEAAGIPHDPKATNEELAKLLPDNGDEEGDDNSEDEEDAQAETLEQRAARKARDAAAAGPVVKRRKKLLKPQVRDMYGWAVNRSKIERSHTYVFNGGITDENPGGVPELKALKERTPAFEQAVMDHYVLHGGLVRGQEKASTVGRMRPIRPMGVDVSNGATTNEVISDLSGSNLEDDEDDE